MEQKWIICPVCGQKTRNQIRSDTELKNFPIFCKWCKKEYLIDAKDFKVLVKTEGTQ